MNWWISQFVLGFALSFWPAPLIGLWLMVQDGQSAQAHTMVPPQYAPPPAFDLGPPEQPPIEEWTSPEPTPIELEPVPEPIHEPPGTRESDHRRPLSPNPKPRPKDDRPPL